MGQAPHRDPAELRATLDERYGRRPAPSRRRVVVAAVVAGAVAVAAFVALALSSTQVAVRTQEAAFRVVDASSVEVTFNVVKDPGVVADCTVVALNESFAQVGVATVRVGPDAERAVPVTASVRTTEPAHGARVERCAVVRG